MTTRVNRFLLLQEQMSLYKEQLKLINARPIKKIAEAKARKKQKVGCSSVYPLQSLNIVLCRYLCSFLTDFSV